MGSLKIIHREPFFFFFPGHYRTTMPLIKLNGLISLSVGLHHIYIDIKKIVFFVFENGSYLFIGVNIESKSHSHYLVPFQERAVDFSSGGKANPFALHFIPMNIRNLYAVFLFLGQFYEFFRPPQGFQGIRVQFNFVYRTILLIDPHHTIVGEKVPGKEKPVSQ
jgi:hypothetical protein